MTPCLEDEAVTIANAQASLLADALADAQGTEAPDYAVTVDTACSQHGVTCDGDHGL